MTENMSQEDLDTFLTEAARQDEAAERKRDLLNTVNLSAKEVREYRADVKLHENTARFLREAHATQLARQAADRVTRFLDLWENDVITAVPVADLRLLVAQVKGEER